MNIKIFFLSSALTVVLSQTWAASDLGSGDSMSPAPVISSQPQGDQTKIAVDRDGVDEESYWRYSRQIAGGLTPKNFSSFLERAHNQRQNIPPNVISPWEFWNLLIPAVESWYLRNNAENDLSFYYPDIVHGWNLFAEISSSLRLAYFNIVEDADKNKNVDSTSWDEAKRTLTRFVNSLGPMPEPTSPAPVISSGGSLIDTYRQELQDTNWDNLIPYFIY